MSKPSAPEPVASPLDDLDRIAAVCDRYRTAWRDGQAPRIESYLGELPTIDRMSLLHELIALDLRLRHERDDPASQVDYEVRFPGDTEVIDAVFRVWQARGGPFTPDTMIQETPNRDGTSPPIGVSGRVRPASRRRPSVST